MNKRLISDMVVYLDGSEGSMSALMYSILLARDTGARLHCLYVINTKALGDLVSSRIFLDSERSEYLEDLKEDARRHLRHAGKLADQKGVEIIKAELEGSPSTEVMKYVKENSIDLLLLGQIAQIRSRREELASENDRMMRTAPCPVLVVRDSDDIWERFEED